MPIWWLTRKNSAYSESNTIPADFPDHAESHLGHTSWFLQLFSIYSKKTKIDRCKHLTQFSFFLWPLIWPPSFFIILVCAKTVHWLKTICVDLFHGWILFHSVPICSTSSDGWRHSTPFTSHWFTSKEKLLSEVFRNCYKGISNF